MRERNAPTTAEQVMPPKKSFLTAEKLEEVWQARGLIYRIDELHISLLSRGLVSSVNRQMFRTTMYNILQSFFVEGDARVDAKHAPMPLFPKLA